MSREFNDAQGSTQVDPLAQIESEFDWRELSRRLDELPDLSKEQEDEVAEKICLTLRAIFDFCLSDIKFARSTAPDQLADRKAGRRLIMLVWILDPTALDETQRGVSLREFPMHSFRFRFWLPVRRRSLVTGSLRCYHRGTR